MTKPLSENSKKREMVAEILDLPTKDFIRYWYQKEYTRNSYARGVGIAQRAMHKSIERGYDSYTSFAKVLELGGNVGEHLPYVLHKFSSYLLTDLENTIDEDLKATLKLDGVVFQQENIESLSFGDQEFDRVLNTCLLHHVSDPEASLLEIRRVLKVGGVADIFLSSDPGLLFRLARALGPRLQTRLRGIDELKTLMDARDHINHVGGLRRLVKHVFRRDSLKERTYPIRGLTWNSSLWHTFRIVKCDDSLFG